MREILTHEALWPHISEGFDGTPEEFWPLEDDSVHYLVYTQNEIPLGIFILHPDDVLGWKIHANVLPEGRGPQAIEAGIEALEYGRRQGIEKISAEIPCKYPNVLAFAEACGMQIADSSEGKIRMEVQFDGCD